MAGSISLTKPIEMKDDKGNVVQTIDALTFGEPTLATIEDLELVIQDGGVRIKLGSLIPVISDLAGIPQSAARKIALADLVAIGKELAGFLPPSLLTGDT